LTASFTENPATIAEAIQLVRSEPESDPTFALAAALGASGTEAAQAALVTLATGDDISPRYAEHALMELGRTAAPTDETIDALKKSLDHKRRDHAQVAALALGNVADARDSEDLIAELAGRLERATRPDEVVNLLLALGNTAHAAAFAPVAARLGEANPAIRASAAQSLRLLPGESATTRLITVLVSDGDAAVRVAAASALAHRPADATLAALESAAQADVSSSVRSEAQKALAKLGRTAASRS
jgi:HEAT repeat protein